MAGYGHTRPTDSLSQQINTQPWNELQHTVKPLEALTQ